MRVDPQAIAAGILDLDRWKAFVGWGPLPGIRSATWRERREPPAGSQIVVTNRDGSTHVETIVAWDPPRALHLRLDGFTAPVRHLARFFEERWTFAPAGEDIAKAGGPAAPLYAVTRTMELHPTGCLTRLVLAAIVAPMLRRAILRHMAQIEAADRGGR